MQTVEQRRAYDRAYYLRNTKKRRAHRQSDEWRARRKKNRKRPEVMAQERAYEKVYRQTPKAKTRIRGYMKKYQARPEGAKQRGKSAMWCRYHLSSTRFENMLMESTGRCGICGCQFSGKEPHIDHDHKTGVVRGLLCHRCNLSLASVDRHGVGWLEKATVYMRHAAGL
jgi:hypothetical protein